MTYILILYVHAWNTQETNWFHKFNIKVLVTRDGNVSVELI